MFGNSHQVSSNQSGPHEDLKRVVQRHLRGSWRAPVADHTREAFAEAARWRDVRGAERPLILDSGCGTGRSSVLWARRHPQALVIGLDQSGDRLARAERRFAPWPDNLLLLRAEAADFWRLARQAQWRPRWHSILYPNPWPKSAHLKRRWHGHPVFPELVALGGMLILRSNWLIYLQEMQQALACMGRDAVLRPLRSCGEEPWTDFEEKYRASGHGLWQLQAELSATAAGDGA